MFLHRVLPPPASNALIVPGHHPNVRRDSLQENRIMTHDQSHGTSEPSKKSAPPESPSLPLSYDLHSISRADTSLAYSPNDGRISRRNYTISDVYQDSEPPTNRPRLSGASVEADQRSRPAVSPSQVCLCQPDPKVPRPRNAFILFRQHHQAEVAKSNPGLANPEISKIIGDYWRRSPPETKIRWKNLAEEEKVRHQKQYPDYRYQPRRAGRGSNASASDGEPGKCPKCGGRSMTAPRLPSPIHENHAATPHHPREATATSPEQHPMHRDQRPSPPTSGSSMHGRGPGGPPYINSPPLAMTPHRYANRASYALSHGGSVSYPYPKGDPMTSPLVSPDVKRRRFDSSGVPYIPRPGSVNSAMGNSSYSHDRHPSITATTRPDGRPAPVAYAHPPTSHSAGYPNPPSSALAPIRTSAGSSQAKSIEAMVMSIPTLGKVRALAKIGRPLADPGPTSPPYATRGAIIAVEGMEDEALKTVISHLRSRLQQGNEHRVKLYYGGAFTAKKGSEPSFTDWLKVIQDWHAEAADIRQFITTIPGSASTPATSPVSPGPKPVPEKSSAEPNETQETKMDESNPTPQATPKEPTSSTPQETPKEPTSSTPQDTSNATNTGENVEMPDADGSGSGGTTDATAQTPTQANPLKRKASEAPSSATATSPSGSGAIPVAIIPRYQLTLTDVAASTIPIADDYSPVEHWHWIAGMWRGIVGPDITIVVRSHAPAGHEEGGGQPTGSRPAAPTNGANVDAKGRPPDVEIHLQDGRAIVLRYEKGQKVGESALRRVGFEVEEWLRSREERVQKF